MTLIFDTLMDGLLTIAFWDLDQPIKERTWPV